MDMREMEKREGIIHWKGKEPGKEKCHMVFLSNFLPGMKSCVGNKEEAENGEGMTDKKEAAETALNKIFGRKVSKKE